MDAGIAKSIKSEFPEAYKVDFLTKKADRSKLGSFSFAQYVKNDFDFIIVNAYIQYHWKQRKYNIDCNAVKQVFSRVKKSFQVKK